jgi:hypothetical protein
MKQAAQDSKRLAPAASTGRVGPLLLRPAGDKLALCIGASAYATQALHARQRDE